MHRRTVALLPITLMALLAVTISGCGQTSQTAAPKVATSTATASTEETYTHVPGANCVECHKVEHKRWSVSLHAASATDVLLNTTHDKAELLTNECIKCHAPYQVKETTIGALVQPLDQKGPWHLGPDAAKWKAIKCEVCYDVRSDKPLKLAFYDGTKGTYLQVADKTALCENCHVPGTDDSRDLKGSVHEGLLCVSCHLRSGMNLDPRDSCRFCHPAVGPKGHPDVTKLDTTYLNKDSKRNIHFVSCKTCHPRGIPAPKK